MSAALTPDLDLHPVADAPGSRTARAVPDSPVPLAGQLLGVPAGSYDWVHVELDATAPGEADWWLYYADGLDPEPLSWAAGVRTVRLPVTRRSTLTAVRLPVAEGVALHSLTLVAPVAVTA
ncbi:hypothetical protein [Actinoplanes sp. NPDC051859]|uniref:hypothetical protein n=1 Tax=Actinoplanes sp. NPDC051859 TaxID=3363909 RepID=UPI0037A2AFC3